MKQTDKKCAWQKMKRGGYGGRRGGGVGVGGRAVAHKARPKDRGLEGKAVIMSRLTSGSADKIISTQIWLNEMPFICRVITLIT